MSGIGATKICGDSRASQTQHVMFVASATAVVKSIQRSIHDLRLDSHSLWDGFRSQQPASRLLAERRSTSASRGTRLCTKQQCLCNWAVCIAAAAAAPLQELQNSGDCHRNLRTSLSSVTASDALPVRFAWPCLASGLTKDEETPALVRSDVLRLQHSSRVCWLAPLYTGGADATKARKVARPQ